MRPLTFWIRALATAIAVCAVTAVFGSLADKIFRRGIGRSKVGEISRGIDAITPGIERRDKEVEELSRP